MNAIDIVTRKLHEIEVRRNEVRREALTGNEQWLEVPIDDLDDDALAEAFESYADGDDWQAMDQLRGAEDALQELLTEMMAALTA